MLAHLDSLTDSYAYPSLAACPNDPDQQLVLPLALPEWLSEDYPDRFISDMVNQLDLSEIAGRYGRDSRGSPTHNPNMMLKVKSLLYGAASERHLHNALPRLREDIVFRVLAANNTPDFRTISDLRKDHLAVFSGLLLLVLRLCQCARIEKLDNVAMDGANLSANASKHLAMSYQMMTEEEAQLAAEVEELLRRAQEVDEAEDAAMSRTGVGMSCRSN